ncbi:MAG: hypothetical protein GY884_19710, partial [Proteobacteria bacterium]|nr:hypothetical protein [Pseudomonadota bacterium]
MISPASVYLLACTWFVVTEEGPTPTFEDTAEEVVEVPDVETGVVEDTEVFDTEAPVFSAELSEVPTMATALELRWEAEGVDRVSASLHLEDGALREVDDLPQEGLVLAPEQSLVLVELTFWREDVVIGTASATASTGTLPEERTPILTMAEGSRVADMAVLYTLSDGDTVTVTLMSGAGQPLWRLGSEALEGYTPTAVQQDLGQPGVVVSRNAGQATGYSSETEGSANDFARYDWRGVLSETLDAPHSHHLFDQPSPGVVAWIKARRADFDEEQDIVWDQIVVSSFEGEERVVVDTEALGDFGQPCAPEGFYPGACDVHHTNSVDCRPDK